MNEYSLQTLVDLMGKGGVELERKAWTAAGPAVRVLSVSGAQAGIAQGVDIHGRPFAPLKGPRPSGGGQPLRDKGLLAASLSAAVTESGVTLSANAPGARLQNYGGRVVPKRGKWLTIPKTVEAQRIGSPGGGRFPRPLFFRAAASSTRAMLCEVVSGKLVVQYVLVKSVTLPARTYLGWSAPTLVKITAVIADKYAEQLVKLFRKG